MNKKIYDGYTYVDGGVCAAKGFTANGLNCGLNPDKNKNDLGMVFSEVPCVAAGVYTQNKVKGAPVTVTKEHLKKSGNKAPEGRYISELLTRLALSRPDVRFKLANR